MSEAIDKLSTGFDAMLLEWLEKGVPTGEFGEDGKERMRKAGPAEAKIIMVRLDKGGALDVGARSSVGEALDEIRQGMPDLSLEDDATSQ